MIVAAFDKPDLILSQKRKVKDRSVVCRGNELRTAAGGTLEKRADEFKRRLGVEAAIEFVNDDNGALLEHALQRQQVVEPLRAVGFVATVERVVLASVARNHLLHRQPSVTIAGEIGVVIWRFQSGDGVPTSCQV